MVSKSGRVGYQADSIGECLGAAHNTVKDTTMNDPNWPQKQQNLALLALGLHRLSERVGDLNFSMLRFCGELSCAPLQRGGQGLKEELQYSSREQHECGTSACAVGHGPSP